MLLQLSLPFLPFPATLSHPIPSISQPHIIVCVHGLCINVVWLIPSPSFISSPTSFQITVSLFPVSKLLLLFCLLCSLDPHVSEIMWYFSFTDWLNSLSIIQARSLYAVAKYVSFLLLHSIPLCKYSTASIHSSIDGNLCYFQILAIVNSAAINIFIVH